MMLDMSLVYGIYARIILNLRLKDWLIDFLCLYETGAMKLGSTRFLYVQFDRLDVWSGPPQNSRESVPLLLFSIPIKFPFVFQINFIGKLIKRLWHRCFPVNFAKLSRTSFLQNTSGRLLVFIKGYKSIKKMIKTKIY